MSNRIQELEAEIAALGRREEELKRSLGEGSFGTSQGSPSGHFGSPELLQSPRPQSACKAFMAEQTEGSYCVVIGCLLLLIPIVGWILGPIIIVYGLFAAAFRRGPALPGLSAPSPRLATGHPAESAPIEDDLTTWNYWWEFNKASFIRLKDAIQAGGPATGSDGTRLSEAKDSLKPTEEQIKNEILPALKKTIDSTEHLGINASCMMAMAKIGTNHPDFTLIDIFRPGLEKPEIRGTAALAIGIAAIADERVMSLLVGLALDEEADLAAAGGSIDDHPRSSATYALGLLAYQHTKIEIKTQAFAAMKEIVTEDRVPGRRISVAAINIKIAAINAIGMLNIGGRSEAEKTLLADALKVLEDFYMKPLGGVEQVIQAHCPPAIAKLIGREHEKSEYFRDLFALDLQEKGKVKRANNFIAQSCAMALGQLARPFDDKDEKEGPDPKYSKLLLDTWHCHKDPQTRNFAVLALGLIGGNENRNTLMKEFDEAGKDQEKSWCALALGVYSFFKYDQQKMAQIPVEFDREIGELLTDTLLVTKNPSLMGALAISLGLNKAIDSAIVIRRRMRENAVQDALAGHLAMGLALMEDRGSLNAIRRLVQRSVHGAIPASDGLLQQAAIALGKLGDKRVAEDLQRLMTDGEPDYGSRTESSAVLKLWAIESALGCIGDSRTVAPLKELLLDEKDEISRLYAASALGDIAAKEPLPWESWISCNMNYRANLKGLCQIV